jgi:hypothetical protein
MTGMKRTYLGRVHSLPVAWDTPAYHSSVSTASLLSTTPYVKTATTAPRPIEPPHHSDYEAFVRGPQILSSDLHSQQMCVRVRASILTPPRHVISPLTSQYPPHENLNRILKHIPSLPKTPIPPKTRRRTHLRPYRSRTLPV